MSSVSTNSPCASPTSHLSTHVYVYGQGHVTQTRGDSRQQAETGDRQQQQPQRRELEDLSASGDRSFHGHGYGASPADPGIMDVHAADKMYKAAAPEQMGWAQQVKQQQQQQLLEECP